MSLGGDPKGYSRIKKPSKVLVSLEELTSMRGDNLVQSLAVLVMGYEFQKKNKHFFLPGQATPVLFNPILTPGEPNWDDLFYAWLSPVIQVRRGRKHVFPSGLPLYYGKAGFQNSVYVAVLEFSRRKHRALEEAHRKNGGLECKKAANGDDQAALEKWFDPDDPANNIELDHDNVDSFSSLFSRYFDYQTEKRNHHDALHQINSQGLSQISAVIGRNVATLTQILSGEADRKLAEMEEKILADTKICFENLIKQMQSEILKRPVEIRYTNVFSFKEHEEWLYGAHLDWGDHRIQLKLEVDVDR